VASNDPSTLSNVSITPMTSGSHGPFRVVILMPVYSDWEAASMVCEALEKQLACLTYLSARILLVYDGTPEGLRDWTPFNPEFLTQIQVLRLCRNIGHQRAICAGLCYVHEHISTDAVLVMDADGQDRPEDAVRLVKTAVVQRNGVIFAERRKRFEGLLFRAGYSSFRTLHRVLTGIPVRVGNFSIISSSALHRLTSMPELWNHYAAAVIKSRIHSERIPLDRGQRLRGQPQMSVAPLVAHGLAGIATFHEIAATRILIANAICFTLLLLSLIIVVGLRLFAAIAIPGWAAFTIGLILILLTQVMAVSFSLVFTLISNRSNNPFIPKRDSAAFVDRLDDLAIRQ
jgi:polyisoprenyl-phosphate glycosyltransferase